MLDTFLKVAYEQQLKKESAAELEELLAHLPNEDLFKIASGTKIADLEACSPKSAEECSFLDKFKGTPLFDQAVALEQEELQAEMADMQKRQERKATREVEDSLWDLKDKLRLKKRMLELDLAKQEGGLSGAAPGGMPGAIPPPPPLPGAPAQGAGAPGPVGTEGLQDGSKTAEIAALRAFGASAGPAMAKLALNLGALGGVAQKALTFAKANPAAAGAAVGALGGAAAGGPEHRLSGALGGAAVGAGAGGVGGRLAAGKSMGQAVAGTARSGINTAMRGANAVAGQVPGSISGRISSVAQGANQAGHDLITRLGG